MNRTTQDAMFLFIFAIVTTSILCLVAIYFKEGQQPDRFQPVNETCLTYGIVRYDNETCIECVVKQTTSYNTGGGRWKNENKSIGAVDIDDGIAYRDCHSR